MGRVEVSNVNLEESVKSEPHRSGFVRNLAGKITSTIYLSGATVVVVTLVTMFGAILANVILRYFFGGGITWASEIPAILFPWSIAGGMVMASAQGRNIAVDIIAGILPAPVRRMLAIAVNLFVSLISVGVVYYSMPIIKASQFSRLAETGIPQIYGYSSLLYAFSMIAVLGLLAVLEYALGYRACVHEPTASNYS